MCSLQERVEKNCVGLLITVKKVTEKATIPKINKNIVVTIFKEKLVLQEGGKVDVAGSSTCVMPGRNWSHPRMVTKLDTLGN